MSLTSHLSKTYLTVGPKGSVPGADFLTSGVDDGVILNRVSRILAEDGGGDVVFRKGEYNLSSDHLWTHSASRTRLIFESGAVVVGDATTTDATPLLTVTSDEAAGSDKSLTANCALGAASVSLSSGDVSTFAAGDYVLLKSDRQVDTESSSKKAGEIKRVRAASGTTVSFWDPTMDAYTTADAAKLTKIPFLEGVKIEGLEMASVAGSSGLTSGSLVAKFVDGFRLLGGRFEDIWAGIQIASCLNFRVDDITVREVQAPGGGTVQYGVWIAAASAGGRVTDSDFRGTRHAVTTGGIGSTNLNGVQRGIIVDRNVSTEANTAHFDTHEPADGVQFTGNKAFGGRALNGTDAVYGIQVRAKNVDASGNEVRAVPGRGIMVFRANAEHTKIIANTIADQLRSGGAAGGDAIYLDSTGSDKGEIALNVIQGAEGRAIRGVAGNDDWDIHDNFIDNVNTAASTQAAVEFTDSSYGKFRDNVVINCPAAPFKTTGTSTGWIIGGNKYRNNGAGESLVGTNVTDANNLTGLWVPKDNGLIAASIDPAVISGSGTQPAAGVMQVARLWVPGGKPISNIHLNLTAAGATLTSGQCKAALFLEDGTWVKSTGDLSSDWATIAGSTNAKTHPLTSSYTPTEDGYVIVGWWGNGTTMPTFLRGVQATGAANTGIGSSPYRFATADTGLTTAAPGTLGAQTPINTAYVVALS